MQSVPDARDSNTSVFNTTGNAGVDLKHTCTTVEMARRRIASMLVSRNAQLTKIVSAVEKRMQCLFIAWHNANRTEQLKTRG